MKELETFAEFLLIGICLMIFFVLILFMVFMIYEFINSPGCGSNRPRRPIYAEKLKNKKKARSRVSGAK